MRSWGIASSLLFAWTAVAAAQPADVKATTGTGAEDSSAIVLGYGAMPGGLRAPAADTLPAGVLGVSLLGGYGVRNGLLTSDHKMSRGIGDVGIAFAPIANLTLGLSFDGRFDKHSGVNPMGDDGYVGDPRFIVRAGKAFGKTRVGGQLTVLVPGKDAPSVATSAISAEIRGLVTLAVGPGSLSVSAGFRVDNSAKSVVDDNGDDNRMLLSAEDRVSLGVSDFHAVIAGAYFQLPIGKQAYVGFEGALDLFLGKDDFGHDAPGPIIKFGAVGGYHINKQWKVFAFLQGAKVPGVGETATSAGDIILVPYEPVFTGGVAIAATFGGKGKPGGGGGVLVVDCEKFPTDPSCKSINVPLTAGLSGKVVDDTGAPVAGAKVTVRLKGKTAGGTTDEKGEYVVKDIPIGKNVNGKKELDDLGAEITVEVSGKKPKVATLTLAEGADNKVPVITLDPVLPPGQFKAVVRAAGAGTSLKGATVKLEPGGSSGTTDGDGNWSIDIQPGTYKATASMQGYKDQTLEVIVEQGVVVVKQFELVK